MPTIKHYTNYEEILEFLNDNPTWIAGFTNGEGSFRPAMSLCKAHRGRPRFAMRIAGANGYEPDNEASLSLYDNIRPVVREISLPNRGPRILMKGLRSGPPKGAPFGN